MGRFLVYNFSGELDDVSHLFPSERLARIAAVIRGAGHEAEVWDRANFDDLDRLGPDFLRALGTLAFRESNPGCESEVRAEALRIRGYRPDAVFLNLWHGAGFKFSADLAGRLKEEDPALRIYGVGQKVDWFRDAILELTGPALDGLVMGLGYDAVDALVAGTPALKAPGVIARDGARIRRTPRRVLDLDDYPLPAYGGGAYPSLPAKIPLFSLSLSNQACPQSCVFCVRPVNYGRVVRRRSTAAALAEVEALVRAHGARHFRIEDSTPPPGALTDFARAVVASPGRRDLVFSAFGRVDRNAREDFTALAAAGFVALFFGLESLDDGVLATLRKGITYAGIRATLERAHAAGLRTVGSFIFPTPGETERSAQTTLDRLRELKPFLDSVLALPPCVLPTTDWGRHPEKYGIRLAPDYLERTVIFPMKYELPIRLWPPAPYALPLPGRPAQAFTFPALVSAVEGFTGAVRNDLGIPRIPDYYYTLARMAGGAPEETWQEIVAALMARNYASLRARFGRAGGNAEPPPKGAGGTGG